jgi:hypothetical protein
MSLGASGEADPQDPAEDRAFTEEVDDEHAGVSDFGIYAGKPVGAAAVHVPRPHDARFELAAAIRRLTSITVGGNLADSEVNRAAAALSEIAEDLERRAGPGRRRRSQPDPAGHPQEFFPTSPVIGFANPVAPPVVVESSDGGLVGRAWFDYPYEGPPTCVHGGVIAMVFDEILGAANIAAGCPGMTGTLTIRYRKPTPLRTALKVEAKCVDVDGRKIHTRGSIWCEDVLTAEAEGIFIQLVPERFISMVAPGAEAAQVLEQLRTDAEHLGFRRPS